MDPQPTVLGDLDPTYQGLIFLDSSLKEQDLESIMGDLVPQDIKDMVLTATRESHTSNQEKVQTLNSKIRSLYTSASGLVNDGVETLPGYGRVQTALNVQQQSILKKCRPFVKPTSSEADPKPGPKDKPASCTRSSATNAPKKKKVQGRRR